jgi:hypothetical protein
MPQKYTNAVLSVLTSNNVPAKDIAVLQQSLEEVSVLCQVSWEFSHDTEVFTANGVDDKQEIHFANAQDFNNAVKAHQLEAMRNHGYHEAFMSGAIAEKESLFKKPTRRELGRIATISVYGDCSKCDGATRHPCLACHRTGVLTCIPCGGSGRRKDGSNCYSCSGGRISCGHCARQGYIPCNTCDRTGKSTTVAKIDLVATQKLGIKTDSQILDHYLRNNLEVSDYPAMMEFVSQRRVSEDSYKQLFAFKARIVTLQLQVCDKAYPMQLLVRNSFWKVMYTTGFIFDDLLRPVLDEMRGLVSQLGKAGPKTLEQFKRCMEMPIVKSLLGGIKNQKLSDEKVYLHLAQKCNAFISHDCAHSLSSMFNKALDFLAPTSAKKEYERPVAWTLVFVLFWATLLAEHGFNWFGEDFLARAFTAAGLSFVLSVIIFGVMGILIAESRSKRACNHIQSALPKEFRRPHNTDELLQAATNRFMTTWIAATVLGLVFALFDVAPATAMLEYGVNGLEVGFMFLDSILF